MKHLLPTFAASFAGSEKSWKEDEKMKSTCQEESGLAVTSEVRCSITVAHFLQPTHDSTKFLMKLLFYYLN